jgi:hypothetical protein
MATLWKIGTASAEGSEYEGEYRGTMVRLVRVTDLGYWPGRNPMNEKDPAVTRWDGYVADGIERISQGVVTLRWDLVAECYQTRREAWAKLKSFIDQKIGSPGQ